MYSYKPRLAWLVHTVPTVQGILRNLSIKTFSVNQATGGVIIGCLYTFIYLIKKGMYSRYSVYSPRIPRATAVHPLYLLHPKYVQLETVIISDSIIIASQNYISRDHFHRFPILF